MRAIDVHAHVNTAAGSLENRFGREISEAIEELYNYEALPRTEEEMARDFIDLDVKALLIPWDSETVTGRPPIGNDYVANIVKKFPDAFLGAWAMVDPWKGKAAINEVERCVKELGMIGLKFQPVAQAFFPDDRRFYPLYEKCVELKIPVAFHTGTTGLGAGLPGGCGYKLKYTRPIHLDDVAADFPDLTIIGIHPSWPWHEEMIAILIHKANVYNDLSGWAPKYFPESLKREINGRLQDKFLFGSEYPEISVKRWLDEFESEGYKPEVMEKVLFKNAQRLFGFH
jgi:predicted TIM-barrel fold metal-dependent hydrolase